MVHPITVILLLTLAMSWSAETDLATIPEDMGPDDLVYKCNVGTQYSCVCYQCDMTSPAQYDYWNLTCCMRAYDSKALLRSAVVVRVQHVSLDNISPQLERDFTATIEHQVYEYCLGSHDTSLCGLIPLALHRTIFSPSILVLDLHFLADNTLETTAIIVITDPDLIADHSLYVPLTAGRHSRPVYAMGHDLVKAVLGKRSTQLKTALPHAIRSVSRWRSSDANNLIQEEDEHGVALTVAAILGAVFGALLISVCLVVSVKIARNRKPGTVEQPSQSSTTLDSGGSLRTRRKKSAIREEKRRENMRTMEAVSQDVNPADQCHQIQQSYNTAALSENGLRYTYDDIDDYTSTEQSDHTTEQCDNNMTPAGQQSVHRAQFANIKSTNGGPPPYSNHTSRSNHKPAVNNHHHHHHQELPLTKAVRDMAARNCLNVDNGVVVYDGCDNVAYIQDINGKIV